MLVTDDDLEMQILSGFLLDSVRLLFNTLLGVFSSKNFSLKKMKTSKGLKKKLKDINHEDE